MTDLLAWIARTHPDLNSLRKKDPEAQRVETPTENKEVPKTPRLKTPMECKEEIALWIMKSLSTAKRKRPPPRRK